MSFTIKDHLLYLDGKQVRYVPTPNHGGLLKPDYLIEHFTGDSETQRTIDWFKKSESQVSAHLLIGRDGEVIQFAPFNVICWHAGQSKWGNVVGLNSHSIGVEHVNAGLLDHVGNKYISRYEKVEIKDVSIVDGKGWQNYTTPQISASVEIASLLVKTYSLKEILGHEQISPGRKIDPGPLFPWDKIRGTSTPTIPKIKGTGVNVRTGPGTDYLKLFQIDNETSVSVLQQKDGWSYVDGKGWVKSDYISA